LQKDRLVTNADLLKAVADLHRTFPQTGDRQFVFTLIPEGVFTRPIEFAQSVRWTAILVFTFMVV
jgi:hypothetical protein